MANWLDYLLKNAFQNGNRGIVKPGGFAVLDRSTLTDLMQGQLPGALAMSEIMVRNLTPVITRATFDKLEEMCDQGRVDDTGALLCDRDLLEAIRPVSGVSLASGEKIMDDVIDAWRLSSNYYAPWHDNRRKTEPAPEPRIPAGPFSVMCFAYASARFFSAYVAASSKDITRAVEYLSANAPGLHMISHLPTPEAARHISQDNSIIVLTDKVWQKLSSGAREGYIITEEQVLFPGNHEVRLRISIDLSSEDIKKGGEGTVRAKDIPQLPCFRVRNDYLRAYLRPGLAKVNTLQEV